MPTLTILGRGPSWQECPFEGEIWATASCLITDGLRDKHYDKVFAFDSKNALGSVREVREFSRIARERGIPIVSIKDYATEPYPIWDIFREFGTGYIRNTVSYMLALAIYKISKFGEYDSFNVYGADQTGKKYEGLKPFIAFWLGVANGRHITYTIASPMMPSYLKGSLWEQVRDGVVGESLLKVSV